MPESALTNPIELLEKYFANHIGPPKQDFRRFKNSIHLQLEQIDTKHAK